MDEASPGYRIVQCDRLVQYAIADDAQHRSEVSSCMSVPSSWYFHEGGPARKDAAGGNPARLDLSATVDLSALGSGAPRAEHPLHPLRGLAVDQRSDQRPLAVSTDRRPSAAGGRP